MNQSKRYRPSSFSTILIFSCLSIIGIALLPFLNIGLLPSPATLTMRVTYSWPNASAIMIEQEVTSTLEAMFSVVRGVSGISSRSSKGSGRIDLSFKKNMNRDAIRFGIASIIRQAYPQLPAGVSYPRISVDLSGERTAPLMTCTIHANASSFDIRKHTENNILPSLSAVKGISDTQLYGATLHELEIEFRTASARQLGITGNDIVYAVNSFLKKEPVGIGFHQQPGEGHVTELPLEIRPASGETVDWHTIPVKKVDGRIVYLGDVAIARYEEQVPASYYRVNGLNTVNLAIYAEKDVNQLALANAIREKIAFIRQHLPQGYSMILANDSTAYLSQEIKKIIFRTTLSLSIILLVVFIASRSVRYLMVVVLSILSTLLIASIAFYLLRVEVQLYSLAGITISLGIITGNSIIMIHHLRKTGNKRILLAMGASALVTIAAVSIILLLPEGQNVAAFAQIVIINLAISFAVTFFLVPALVDQLMTTRKKANKKKWTVTFIRRYRDFIIFNKRFKWAYIILFTIGFGIPLHWLPPEIKGEGRWATFYNQTFGNNYFYGTIKPVLEKCLGGSLRLFTEGVFANSRHVEPSKTMLHVKGSMPEGCTVQQLNSIVQAMEKFISRFEEIELFQTTVSDYNDSEITIHFKPEHELTGFPYFLKDQLEAKAIDLGGADWSVQGVGVGFSNAVQEIQKSDRVILKGYNYQQLYHYAGLLRKRLMENPRIKDADIIASEHRDEDLAHEFSIELDEEQLALDNVSVYDLYYKELRDNGYRRALSPAYTREERHPVYVSANTSPDAWTFNNVPLTINNSVYKMSRFGVIEKRRTGNSIYRHNQQYQLMVAFDFIGASTLANDVRRQQMEAIRAILPVGYSIEPYQYSRWDKDNRSQYYFIMMAIIVIYFICAILLESLVQPLAIISTTPVSFTGAFLTFYLFDINFDHGGFVSFVLLSGLTVGTGLYIVNDYNNHMQGKPQKSLAAYMMAFRYKIVPVILATLCSVLGLTPFLINNREEVFWSAFAAGTAGGLLFSIAAVFIYLPLFLRVHNKKRQHQHVTI